MSRIKDIAIEAKVSEGTVDRVIHNRGNVSKKTEAKIRKIMELHNFTVNPIASALAMRQKQNISVLIPEFNDADLFWESPFLGSQKAADDVKSFGIGVRPFKFNQNDSKSYLKAFEDLLETKPSAVIIVPSFLKETKQIVGQLEALEIPYIFINIDIDGFNNLAYIGQDSYKAGYIGGKLMHLKNPNSSEFLIIQSRHNITENNSVTNRIKGFNDYYKENKIPSKSKILKIENITNSQETTEKLNTYLNEHQEVKGIFVPSSRIHLVAKCLGEKFVKNIVLIGFDNTPQNTECLLDDKVSFLISQKPFDQGYQAVRLFSDYLLYNKVPENKLYLPIDILIKENVNYNKK
ncbi:LacI family transcriptional regulator [Winogradskyella sp.]|nr:LacI family transcriptional regulator [Winogradskyella sp.]